MSNLYSNGNGARKPIRNKQSSTFKFAAGGAGLGAVIGAALGGPVGAMIGGALGGGIGGAAGADDDDRKGR